MSPFNKLGLSFDITEEELRNWGNVSENEQELLKLKAIDALVAAGGIGCGGVTQFLSLTDAPNTYEGSEGKVVAVKEDGTGLEFVDAVGGGTGNVTGQASSVDGEVALFSGTTGKVIKRASISGLAKLTSGVLSAATAGTDYQMPPGISSVAYSATLTPALASGRRHTILRVGALTGNIVIANPSGTPADGDVLQIELLQDSTGGREITSVGSKYNVPSSSSITFPYSDGDFTTANKRTKILWQYYAGVDKWDFVSLVPGY